MPTASVRFGALLQIPFSQLWVMEFKGDSNPTNTKIRKIAHPKCNPIGRGSTLENYSSASVNICFAFS